MTAAAIQEAREHVAELIKTYPRATPLKAALPSIARRIGVSARRVAAIWHREARAIYSTEMDALRAAVSQCLRSEIARLERELSHAEAELAVALLTSDRIDSSAVFAAKAAVENAKTLLKGAK